MIPLAVELAHASTDAANLVIPALERVLRNLAKESAWPDHIIQYLSLQYDGESIILTYPPELAQEIDDLEYGTLNRVPNAVIRPFLSRSDEIVGNVLSTNILDDIVEMEEVF